MNENETLLTCVYALVCRCAFESEGRTKEKQTNKQNEHLK